ncbi:MAG: hypothetical protein HYS86_03860 [Candidatus Chisholmbacteria bacterium]|nr:hypothetical protein [Candidatus Chisholmbacteria bacterium]
MTTIRTTISLPADVYEAVRQESFLKRRSFGEVIAHRFRSTKRQDTPTQPLTKDFSLFDQIASSGKSIDLKRALRQERNRHNA